MESFKPFAVSLLIGLLIGFERGRAHPSGTQPIGLRTFVLVSLLGCLAGFLKEPVFSAGAVAFVVLGTIVGYLRAGGLRKRDPQIGLTTEVAAIVIFGLGFLTNSQPVLALGLSVIVLFLLSSKQRLHNLARAHITQGEVDAVTKILLISLGVIPFLPAEPIDSWGILPLQKFFGIVVALSVIQFAGYFATKILGPARGLMTTGFLSGFASSTAFTISSTSAISKHPSLARVYYSGTIFSSIAKLILVFILLLGLAPVLAQNLLAPLGSMIVVGALVAYLIGIRSQPTPVSAAHLSPLNLVESLRMALILFAAIVGISFIRKTLGPEMVLVASFFGGLFELHGIVGAAGALFAQGQIELLDVRQIIAMGVFASFISKIVIVVSKLGFSRAVPMIAAWLLMLLIGGLVYQFETVL